MKENSPPVRMRFMCRFQKMQMKNLQKVDGELTISDQYLTQLVFDMVDQNLGSITISYIT